MLVLSCAVREGARYCYVLFVFSHSSLYFPRRRRCTASYYSIRRTDTFIYEILILATCTSLFQASWRSPRRALTFDP